MTLTQLRFSFIILAILSWPMILVGYDAVQAGDYTGLVNLFIGGVIECFAVYLMFPWVRFFEAHGKKKS